MIYGDNPDANLLERAVRWVIIMLVIVFDPLAVMMLLAATESRKWIREDQEKPKYDQDDGPLTTEQIEQIKETVDQSDDPSWMIRTDPSPPGWMYNTTTTYPSTEEEVEELKNEFDRGRHAYLDKPFVHFENLKPMPAPSDTDDDEILDELDEHSTKLARAQWKKNNPGKTLKEQRSLLDRGLIDHLPWKDTNIGFGKELPQEAQRGEMFIISDLPSRLYKFNGDKWIEVDKESSSSYTYNESYINHLIEKIQSGEYDPSLLTDNEREQIELLLQRDV